MYRLSSSTRAWRSSSDPGVGRAARPTSDHCVSGKYLGPSALRCAIRLDILQKQVRRSQQSRKKARPASTMVPGPGLWESICIGDFLGVAVTDDQVVAADRVVQGVVQALPAA